MLQRLRSPADSLTTQLSALVSAQELQALTQRLEALIKEPKLPVMDPYRDIPWPLV